MINISTKAETLMALSTLLKKSKIEKFFVFTITEWKNKKKEILEKIKQEFPLCKIVIRSSAISEDTLENSMAGSFKSILNVNPKNTEEVLSAVDNVLKSYKHKLSESSFNQILVQKQTEDIAICGVIFTRSPEKNSPYYIINYDDTTGYTHTVTAGIENKSIKISRFAKLEDLDINMQKLIEAVKEIESLIPHPGLDIEFAINKNKEVVIFQVRPLTALPKFFFEDSQIWDLIEKLKNNFNELSKSREHLSGEKTILADMPDWNPAEIIGDSPNHLAYSLYDYIITNSAWHEARTSQGYYNVNPAKLVVLIGNKPYVDTRNSFNSFTPVALSKELREKLVSFYLDKLEKNPELQDKVEFNILFTCYDLCFEQRALELLETGFRRNEIEELRKAIIDLTNNLISKSKKSIEEDLKSLEEMKKTRADLKNKHPYDDAVFYLLSMAKFLLDDCRKKGTVQFSRLARLGFIGKILLESMIKKEIIDNKFYDNFMNSINTVASDFKKDFILMNKGEFEKENFIKKYYHLRPGSYDITTLRYEDSPHLLKTSDFDILEENLEEFLMNSATKEKIDNALREHGLNFNSTDLFNFTKSSLEARELSKFEFTKNLSDAMELIAMAGELMGFTRQELAMLFVEDIFSDIKGRHELAEKWKKTIYDRQKQRELNEKLELPPIIFSENDFDFIKYYTSKPNYITQKKVKARLLKLDKDINEKEIGGSIVMIENGDPGYDWIFTRNPAGLITKYGGVASHMSIRCAEFGIPAAIGCGVLFDKLNKVKEIILDCKIKKIIPFEVEKYE